jgi:dTDP-4-amino-4,6-dideoxygalactose transaminase
MKDLGYNESFPEAEGASTEVLSLPVHPGLNKMDLDKIISTVNEF